MCWHILKNNNNTKSRKMPQKSLIQQECDVYIFINININKFYYIFSVFLLISYFTWVRYNGKEECSVLIDPGFSSCSLLCTFTVVLLEYVHPGVCRWLGKQNTCHESMLTYVWVLRHIQEIGHETWCSITGSLEG